LATVVSDLDRLRVIEVLDGRSRRTVERYLRSFPEYQRKAIAVVSIGPFEAYRQAIRAALPEARIVADRFHLVRAPTRRLTRCAATDSARRNASIPRAPAEAAKG
jgi:transposase